jgi:hypothetical protein
MPDTMMCLRELYVGVSPGILLFVFQLMCPASSWQRMTGRLSLLTLERMSGL